MNRGEALPHSGGSNVSAVVSLPFLVCGCFGFDLIGLSTDSSLLLLVLYYLYRSSRLCQFRRLEWKATQSTRGSTTHAVANLDKSGVKGESCRIRHGENL